MRITSIQKVLHQHGQSQNWYIKACYWMTKYVKQDFTNRNTPCMKPKVLFAFRYVILVEVTISPPKFHARRSLLCLFTDQEESIFLFAGHIRKLFDSFGVKYSLMIVYLLEQTWWHDIKAIYHCGFLNIYFLSRVYW